MTDRSNHHNIFALALIVTAIVPIQAQVSVLTQHNDNQRTGQNLQETVLNRSNVNVSQFGKLFALPVDAQVYAQPLFVPNVNIPGQGSHNVVYIATMNDSVYAYDADSNGGSNANPLWRANFTNPAAGITPVPSANLQIDPDIIGPVGIESTPVIDPSSGTIYVLARTLENGSYFQRLHALDITTGAEKFGGPVVIQASVTGSNGTVNFDPMRQNQRVGLSLNNGQVYIVWASHNDYGTYHGWVIEYNAATLAQTAVFNDTPDGNQGGIWQAGQAPSFDASGNAYLSTGNGTWDGTRNFGSSIIKLSPSLTVLDWFTPDNFSYLNANDLDLGASGPMLIPNTNLLVTGGKPGVFFLLNTNNLGHLSTHNSQVTETFLATNGHIHGSPIYWDSPTQGPLVYVQSEFDYLKAFPLNGTTMGQQPVSQSVIRDPDGMPGGFMTVTSNGTTAGTGIVWASTPLSGDANHQTVQGILRAYNADDLTSVLWDTQQNAARDDLGNFAKFAPPTAVNGKVYLATFSNQVVVYGLLSSSSDFAISGLPTSQSVAPGSTIPYTVSISSIAGNNFQGTVNLSVSGLPSGATAVFSPTSVGGTASSTLTVTAGSGTAQGTYTLTVTAKNGTVSHTLALTLVVNTAASGAGAGVSGDVGGPSPAGTSSYSNGTYTVSGSGNDIWGTSDQFHFTYWQLTGDGSITARLVSPANAGFYSKSGVMIRETLAPNSSYALLAGLPSLYALQYRNATGATAASTPYNTPAYPQWIRLVRANGNFTGYVSADGNTWNQVGDPVSIGMAQTVYVGLVACSQSPGTLSSATFDNVSYTAAAQKVPDFSISTTPYAYASTVLAGNTVNIPVTVNAVNGFTGTVGFTASGLPSGTSFVTGSVTGSGSTTLSINTSTGVPTGPYGVTLKATSGTLTRDITISLSVSNYSIAATPASQTVTAGATAMYQISDTDANSYSGLAQLTISGLPAGVTAFFEPAAVDRIVTSTLSLTTAAAAAAGTYNLTVTGTSNGQTRTTPIQLIVKSNASFTLSASPTYRSVAPGAAATYTISSAATGGFSGAISLAATGLPTGATASFNPASITGAATSVMTIQTAASTPAGSFTVTVSGSSGSLSGTTQVTLGVGSPSFGSGAGTDLDIGGPSRAGSGSLSGGVYTVTGSGIDIWYGSDQFNFNYWPLTGDGVLTARVKSLTNTAAYAKAGLMVRQSLAPNSPYALAVALPSLYSFHYRTVADNYASQGSYYNVTFPIWMRLVRSNGNFTAYSSPDGQSWTQINQTVSVSMTGTVYAGLAVTSENPSATATATFDYLSFTPSSSSAADFTITPASAAVQTIGARQAATYSLSLGALNGFAGAVNLSASGLPAGATAQLSPATVTNSGSSTLTVKTSATTPPGWYAITVSATSGATVRNTSVTVIVQNLAAGASTDADIGQPAIAGGASQNAGVFTVQGSGSDIWQTSDQFNFNFWQATGDVTITARLKSITNTNFYAKAGLMIRETLNANSAFAYSVGIPTLFNFHYRLATGASVASGPYFNATYPMWLRLVRSKGTFTAYSSTDGNAWTQINSPVSINMASTVYVGLAVASHDVTKLNTAVFDNVVITQP